MPYLHKPTGRYPVSEQEIRNLYPETIFPAQFVPPDEYAWVFAAPQPPYDSITHGVREGDPVLTSKGHYEQAWVVFDLPPEQVEANQQAARERLMASVIAATQARLDGFARTRNYDGILSLCTYATSSVPKFAAEGQRGVDLRDMTWARLYEIMAEVEDGTRPMPTGFAEIEPLLPALEWPA